MNLNWVVSERSNSPIPAAGDGSKYVVHQCSVEGSTEREAQQAVDACIDKACALLEHSIQDDSRYLLFGWDADTSTLTIVVTDDQKQQDSRDLVKCHFIGEHVRLNPEDMQYWIKEYLSICTQFLRYSLIAAFHTGSRASCTLL